jgi:hypothetical protein
MSSNAVANYSRHSQTTLWPIAMLLSFSVVVFGLYTSDILNQPVWGGGGLVQMCQIGALFTAASLIVIRLRPRFFGPFIALIALLLALIGSGPGATAALLAFLISSQAVGDLVWGERDIFESAYTDAAIRLSTGVASYCSLTALMVYFPINTPALYWTLVIVSIFSRRHRLLYWLRVGRGGLCALTASTGAFTTIAMTFTGFCLIVQFLSTLNPERSHDGLAMHLYAPGIVAAKQYWPFSVLDVEWAAMPMAADWGYTYVFLLGGEGAARMLNFAALACLAVLLFTFIRSLTSPNTGLLLTSAFLSSPVVNLITGSMFIDNFLALWILSITVILVSKPELNVRGCYATGVLMGTALQTKFGALPVVLILLVLLFSLLKRSTSPRPINLFLRSVTLALGLGCIPYVTAWVKTGNPLYPINLPISGSLPTPLLTTPFHEPLRWTTLYDLTFNSGKFLESQNGSFGLHYLILIPLGVIGLFLGRDRSCRKIVAIAILSFSVIYLGSSYIRYLYPTLPLFVAGASGAIHSLENHSRLINYATRAIISLLSLVNLYMMPSSGWYEKAFSIPEISREAYVQHIRTYAPVRAVTDYLNLVGPGNAVAYLGTTNIGGIRTTAYTMSWHHSRFSGRIASASSAAAVAAIMKEYGVTWFVCPEILDSLPGPLKTFLTDYTLVSYAADQWQARGWGGGNHFKQELIKNGEFDEGIAGWSMYGTVNVTQGRALVSTKNTISQSFNTSSGRQYLYALTASCPQNATELRLQINWISSTGALSDVLLKPIKCDTQEREYKIVATAPSGSVAGVVIVGGHSGEGISVARVSLKE